jgi:sRNA-binding regulator protein Hfq/DNA-binding Xre family transcriptional regulator
MEDLWKIRLKKQMTVAQLSARAGIPARRLREYEAGERSIPMGDMEKLAKALYVDVMDIEPLSSPIPDNLKEAVHNAPPDRAPMPAPQPRRGPPPPSGGPSGRPTRAQRQAAPARSTQIEHLTTLAKLFEWDKSQLEHEVGKPLAQLTRAEASQWLKQLQDRVVTERPRRAKKRRPYLPESIDSFEMNYLAEKQEQEVPLTFVLFDGKTFLGKVVGFGPYNITIEADGQEITLNKLAIAYYYPPAGEES